MAAVVSACIAAAIGNEAAARLNPAASRPYPKTCLTSRKLSMPSFLKISAAAAMICYFNLAPAAAAELTITVDHLRSNQGQLLLCVFSAESSDKQAFPDCTKGRPVREGKYPIRDGKAVVTYKGLKDGVYAVAAIHDENGNGALDANFLGIPTEGIGISANPRLMGKPSFAEAQFEIKGKTAITVETKYLL